MEYPNLRFVDYIPVESLSMFFFYTQINLDIIFCKQTDLDSWYNSDVRFTARILHGSELPPGWLRVLMPIDQLCVTRLWNGSSLGSLNPTHG